jgi:glutamate carboxypeptidase
MEGRIGWYPLPEAMAAPLLDALHVAARDIGLPPPAGVQSGGGSDGNLTAALGIPTLDGLGAVGGHPHGAASGLTQAA